MEKLGGKIVIAGVSASGKSTFARKLAQEKHLPLVFLDTLMWKSDWTYVGDETAVVEIERVSSEPGWIIEGYVAYPAREVLFSRADTIIFLDYSRMVAVLRYIKRWFQYRKNARPELNGNTERFRWKLLWRIWSKKEVIKLKEFLKEYGFEEKVIYLNSLKETNRFLKSLKAKHT